TRDPVDLVWSLSHAVGQLDPNNHGRAQCCCLVATQPERNCGRQLGCLILFWRHSTSRSDDDGLALVREFGTSYSVPAQIGYTHVAELILLELPFDAKRAAERGFVTRIVPTQKLRHGD